MKYFGLVALAALGAHWAWRSSDDEVKDFVVTQKYAYAVLPPEAIANFGIRHIEWSPSGNYLLMVQQTPKLNPGQAADAILGNLPSQPKSSLLVWSRATGRTVNMGPVESLFGESDPGMTFDDVDGGRLPILWNAVTDSGYIQVSRPENEEGAKPPIGSLELRRVDLAKGSMQTLSFRGATEGIGSMYEIDVSPTNGRLIVVQTCVLRAPDQDSKRTANDTENFLWTIDPSGVAGKPEVLGPGFAYVEGWLKNGTTAVIRHLSEFAPTRRMSKAYFDVASESMAVPANTDLYESPDREGDLEIRTTSGTITAGTVKKNYRALWLSATGAAEVPTVLLSASAESAVLSPGLDRVALLEKGVVTLRPIAAMNLSVWREVAKKEAMEVSKFAALGLLMYSADYDDVLPSPSDFDQGVIDPYLKDDRYRGRFTYLLKGGALNGFANPAETAMGYVLGPGGYALAFLDGHVTWRTGDPPRVPPAVPEPSTVWPEATHELWDLGPPVKKP